MSYAPKNNARTTLASALSDVATSMTVQAGKGALFALGAGEYDYIALENATTGAIEIVKQTARSGDSLTIERAQDGTTALAWNIGDIVESRLCIAGFAAKESVDKKDATGGYAGLTLFKINFMNALGTFKSFFANANTAARTYTFQDRDGTIADNTDLAGKANAGNVPVDIHAAATKGTPANSDEFPLVDSAASWGIKKFSWADLKIALTTFFDTLYMAIVAPGTAGNVLTSTGSAWASSALSLSDWSASFMVTKSANQIGIVTATPTLVTFDTELFDTNANFASNRFTPTRPGVYHLTAAVYLQSAVDQTEVRVTIYKNGSPYKASTTKASGTGGHQALVSCDAEANGTDYFEMYILHTSGSNKDVDNDSQVTYFCGARVG